MSIEDTCHEQPHRPSYPADSEHKVTHLEHPRRLYQVLESSLYPEAPPKSQEETLLLSAVTTG
jgi:hypothetical protein